MNRYQRRQNLRAMKSNGKLEDPNRNVTRQELVEAVDQMGENVGLVQQGLVEAVNTMYANQLFPFQIETAALEKLLIEKGIITQEEMDNKVQEHKQSVLDKAQVIKENSEGKLETVSDDEAKETVNKAVVKASAKSKKKKED